ncbi:hypothetical protein K461DRAFT_279831 [Myriangium duriaei CBS 260.36]|uniref:Chitin-binding type-1 domain-containing protein n=1 Tax=Myriangium duriaei CBS 260.36 TaxID=1168546 RepID=A0A9P4IW67_9PEZI|nr:hypothetical protein K461DRAFT_279831 [Myriangium duriaei CBS 260.36]
MRLSNILLAVMGLSIASGAFIPQKKCKKNSDCYYVGGACGVDGFCGGTGAYCIDSTSCLSVKCAKVEKVCLA